MKIEDEVKEIETEIDNVDTLKNKMRNVFITAKAFENLKEQAREIDSSTLKEYIAIWEKNMVACLEDTRNVLKKIFMGKE